MNSKALSILRHPAWLTCFGIFALHQVAQKGLGISTLWADNYLDCLLCMPIFLGFVLTERRILIQNKQYRFSPLETLVMVVVLALIFEEGFPRLSGALVKDYWDYLAYLPGALFFHFFINEVV